jgi:2-(1,2-epoxy-1,2-dihydrophenyl)acetyl-CoA isomerase
LSSFSAGGDIKLFHRSLQQGDQSFRLVFRHLNTAIQQIRGMPKPVVAAVQGPAYAAGLGVALACDLIVASHGSTLSPSFINIALAPNASTTFFLPRLLGPRRAAEALMRGRVFSASEALELGMINHVWAEGVFEEELQNLLKDLAARPSGALARIKHLLNASQENTWLEQIELEKEEISLSALSEDFQEGVAAFVEKRRPKFNP